MKVLLARLKALAGEKRTAEASRARREQVRTGDRSEKIRTYNYPQNRVTDHRAGFTTHRLPDILDGDLDELFKALAGAASEGMMGRPAAPDNEAD
jgi:peptide chain release factor 1